ncbi:FtsK/SpoIIIE domain-containing protein [Actinotignum urinale]|uniref:FtsK/SpoIIIE domain-containing protein n=1 Tax=Actinotignum urinale TaxID=190146 RepID=UPI000C7FDE1D|nr:FtsK/SpoIIIE domain-containing protein [Actinotignum urinale]WIK59478.1 FtsK/SpoIIIE domain-containing protein [Actinotignum urinale]
MDAIKKRDNAVKTVPKNSVLLQLFAPTIESVALPPEVPKKNTRTRLLTACMPLIGSLGIIVFMIFSPAKNPLMILTAGLMGIGCLAVSVGTISASSKERRREIMLLREKYATYLDHCRDKIRNSLRGNRVEALKKYPDPHILPFKVESDKVWRKCNVDEVRIGRASQKGMYEASVATELSETSPDQFLPHNSTPQKLSSPHAPTFQLPAEYDHVSEKWRSRLIDTYANQNNMPAVIDFSARNVWIIRGKSEVVQAWLRAILCNIAMWVNPNYVKIVLKIHTGKYEWLRWLPHLDSVASKRLLICEGYVPENLKNGDIALCVNIKNEKEMYERYSPVRVVDISHKKVNRPGSIFSRVAQNIQGIKRMWRIRDTARVGCDSARVGCDSARVARDRTLVTRDTAQATQETQPFYETHGIREPVQPDYSPTNGGITELHVLEIKGENNGNNLNVEPLFTCLADMLQYAEAETIARGLARKWIHMPDLSNSDAVEKNRVNLQESGSLLHITGADISQAKNRFPADKYLCVPVGVKKDGAPLWLNLNESARGGSGPHGLIIGATGSGKSELLKNILFCLAATHDSRQLNYLLVDFKGGATFQDLEKLPHTAAVVTNLAGDIGLVARMETAIRSEIERRQETLARAGGYANIHTYMQAKDRGEHDFPDLAELLIVVDEFSELLATSPEFHAVFMALGRVGRSLGMHLILASQRIEDSAMRGLDTHMSFRIALRTFSTYESRSVIGEDSAFYLPQQPGAAYLSCGAESPEFFQAYYISEPMKIPQDLEIYPSGAGETRVLQAEQPKLQNYKKATEKERLCTEDKEMVWSGLRGSNFTLKDRLEDIRRRKTSPIPSTSSVTTLDLPTEIIRATQGQQPAHCMWLPPLETSPSVDNLWEEWRNKSNPVSEERLGAQGEIGDIFPVAYCDLPQLQQRTILTLEATGRKGHIAVVGGQQSGKTNALATIMCSVGRALSPHNANFYVIDIAGGGLKPWAELPHVATYASRKETEKIQHITAHLLQVMEERESSGQELHVSVSRDERLLDYESGGQEFPCQETQNPDSYNHHNPTSQAFCTPLHGNVPLFVFVDGWGYLRNDFPDIEEQLTSLLERGGAQNIYVVATAMRWSQFRMATAELFGTIVELQLGDAFDSRISRTESQRIPSTPGRGLIEGGHHILWALPDKNSVRVEEIWNGVRAKKLQTLPEFVGYERGYLELASTGVPKDNGKLAGNETSSINSHVKGDDILHIGNHVIGGESAHISNTIASYEASNRRNNVTGCDTVKARMIPPMFFGETVGGKKVMFDFNMATALLIHGPRRTGKTSMLRLLCTEICRIHEPGEAKIFAFDAGDSFANNILPDYLGAHIRTVQEMRQIIAELADYCEKRIAGQRKITTHAYVIIDDYDVLLASTSATFGSEPLLPLLPLLATAEKIGLHIILASANNATGFTSDSVTRFLNMRESPKIIFDDAGGTPGKARLIHGNTRTEVQIAYVS